MRDLVFVSAGLDLDGGGRAAAGRLLAASCAAYARARGLGFSILSLGQDAHPGGLSARPFSGRQGALALTVLRRQLARRNTAHVFDLLGPSRIAAWIPGRLRGPYLISLLGIEVWRELTWDRSLALRKATVRLAISAYTATRARQVHPDLPPIDVLPICLEALLSALARNDFRQDSRPGLRLVVAGDGDDRPRLEGIAGSLGLAERVLFTGFVSEATLAELYRCAAVFAMPSRGEGFGLVYLEAMRAGKPCVAAHDGSAPEIVLDGETGLLVDPGSPEAIARALERLSAEPDFARRLGEAGRRREREVYTVERYRQGLAPYLDRLMGSPDGIA
jgi:phosphatidyl-myo-inositol dimannoside synthase